MYGIRPDLPQAVSMVSRHMGKPRKEHWQVVKTRPSTTDIGQDYQSKTSCALARYSYFDYTTNLDARWCMIGYAFKIGNSLVSWKATL